MSIELDADLEGLRPVRRVVALALAETPRAVERRRALHTIVVTRRGPPLVLTSAI
ncbi:MAG: hypothetical protein M3Q31_12305 [Actinomycetota bacterium]|nr:hypothetical protein [Actinomycetota bacterium]